MRKVIKNMWVSRLEGRVGDFKQTTSYLEDNGSYCCLGVLNRVCEQLNIDVRKAGCNQTLDPAKLMAIGIGQSETDAEVIQNELIEKNDGQKESFKEIAQWIKVNL